MRSRFHGPTGTALRDWRDPEVSQFRCCRSALHQVMLVAHLTDIQPVEEIGISVSLVTPRGASVRPTTAESIVIEMAGEYVLTTLRDVPLAEEGLYRFEIALTGQPPTSVAISVLTANRPIAAQCH